MITFSGNHTGSAVCGCVRLCYLKMSQIYQKCSIILKAHLAKMHLHCSILHIYFCLKSGKPRTPVGLSATVVLRYRTPLCHNFTKPTTNAVVCGCASLLLIMVVINITAR